jgi:hypothetical protein
MIGILCKVESISVSNVIKSHSSSNKSCYFEFHSAKQNQPLKLIDPNGAEPIPKRYITCNRGSAKHSVRTTTLSMETCDFQASAQPKPLNRSKYNFTKLTTSARLRDVPKMVAIGWLEVAPQIGEI